MIPHDYVGFSQTRRAPNVWLLFYLKAPPFKLLIEEGEDPVMPSGSLRSQIRVDLEYVAQRFGPTTPQVAQDESGWSPRRGT